MKKLFIAAMGLILVSITINAQKPFTMEANAGFNVSKFNSWDSKFGYHIGLRANISIKKGLYANAGVLLSAKGASLDWGDLGYQKIRANYLEIPIHLGYQYNINDKFGIFGEFGPYFACGIFGKTKIRELDWDDDYTNEDYKTFDNDGIKRFDAGIGFRIGAEFKHKFILALGYDFGLLDIYNGGEADDAHYDYYDDEEDIDITGSLKNRNFYVSFGFRF